MEKIVQITVDSKKKEQSVLPFAYCGDKNEKLGATSGYLTRNGKPWIPVMGEFHFSRFFPQFWKEAVEKMKAGGIQILATYVFWIHHEEREGEWDFSGQRDLHRFVEICKACSMPVLLRIGPWSHGECRNGGFPDWLLKKSEVKVRTDQENYLHYVEILFEKIFCQVDGFFWEQGGPILGIQIENEYGHCGGLGGEAGIQHMKKLKELAIQKGFRTPYYTATGWGGAIVPEGEMLPVLGAYCDAPWEQHIHEMPLNANYLFSSCKDDGNIGTDLQLERQSQFTYDVEKYPYLTAELGGGMQVTSHRRPIADKKDTCAMAMCKLGSGANLLGYYMYHGGTNPVGRDSYLQESKATGYLNDLPRFSYDFQAPIGEFGRIHEVFYHLRPLHLFLQEFGEELASMETVFPSFNALRPEELSAFRMVVRHDPEKNSGFLFINAYQRHAKLEPHSGVKIEIATEKETFSFPEMEIPDGRYGIYPYGFSMGKQRLESADAQLLCRLGEQYVFVSDAAPQLRFRGESGNALTLSRHQAEHAFKLGEKLYIAESGCLCVSEKGAYLLTEEAEGSIWKLPENTRISYQSESSTGQVQVSCREETEEYAEYQICISYQKKENLNNFWLALSFDGDRAELYLDGELCADWFYTGLDWEIGLSYFAYPKELKVRVYPVKEAVYTERKPAEPCALKRVRLWPEYKIPFAFEKEAEEGV